VEKEVVLLDQQQPALPTATAASNQVTGMQVDVAAPLSNPDHTQDVSTGPKVLKIIKKIDVQVLCAQHNPVRSIFFNCWTDLLLKIQSSGRCSSEESFKARQD
jgi:hypothetical protein